MRATFCLVVVAALAITLNAQSVGTPKAGAPVTKLAIEVSHEIKAIGCLAKEADGYVLNNAAVEVTPWVAPNLRPDAVGVRKSSSSKTAFVLKNQAGLDAHVGHIIEVSGIVAPATANLPPSPDTIAPAGGVPGLPQAAAPGGQGVNRVAHPELENTGLRMISSSCAQK